MEKHEFKPGELSFIIENANDIRLFYEEQLPIIKKQGFTVYFSDGGWMSIEQYLNRSELLTVSKLAAFAVAALLAELLTVYLFVVRKKKDFAIMRALGATCLRAKRALLVPLLFLTAVAVILGGIAANLYAQSRAEYILADFISLGVEVETSIPLYGITLGILSEFVFILIAAVIGLGYIGRKPPLVLLQESGDKRSRKKKTVIVKDSALNVKFSSKQVMPLPEKGEYNLSCYTLRYIMRHAYRSTVKSVLSIALALFIVAAIGQLTAMRGAYSELYHNIEIKPSFINGLPLSYAQRIEKSGYVHDAYYEYTFHGEANEHKTCEIVIASNPERAVNAIVEYMDGYNTHVIGNVRERICAVSDDILEELGLSVGDKIGLNEYNYKGYLVAYSEGKYSDEELQQLYNRHTVTCTIVGRIMDSEKSVVWIPIEAKDYFAALTRSINLDLAEYLLNDYHQAIEFTKYADDIVTQTNGITRPIFLMDTSEADNIYMIYRLIETLYPIALIAAILIGSGLPGLIILQSAREASILRVLGTTKKRTRLMLLLEQVFLCDIGLLLALFALGVINGSELTAVAVPIGIYCALHFIGCVVGSAAASISVTKKEVLDLLQTKE